MGKLSKSLFGMQLNNLVGEGRTVFPFSLLSINFFYPQVSLDCFIHPMAQFLMVSTMVWIYFYRDLKYPRLTSLGYKTAYFSGETL